MSALGSPGLLTLLRPKTLASNENGQHFPSQDQSRVVQIPFRGNDADNKYLNLPDGFIEARAEEPQQESGVPFTPGRSKSQGYGHSRVPSKASTLAPSDSPSVAGVKYYKKRGARSEQQLQEKEQAAAALLMKSPRSQGHYVSNPMSPKSPAVRSMSPRHQVTQDLMQGMSTLPPRALLQASGRSHGRVGSGTSGHQHRDHEEHTPTQSRRHSQVEEELDEEEEEMVRTILSKTPGTSMALSTLEPDVQNSHFHDMELCELLHSFEAPNLPEVVKKSVRKSVRARVRKLGMKSDNESIRQYRMSFHDHDPRVHLQPNFVPELSERSELPEWARELIQGMLVMEQRLDHLVPKIEHTKWTRAGSISDSEQRAPPPELDDSGQTYMKGVETMSDDLFYQPDTAIVDSTTVRSSAREDSIREGYDVRGDDEPHHDLQRVVKISTRGLADDDMAGAGNDSPGHEVKEELYRLRMEISPEPAVDKDKSWEVAGEDGGSDLDFGMTETPATAAWHGSPSPPPIPQPGADGEVIHIPEPHWTHQGYGGYVQQRTPPWKLIHQLLLYWAMIWSMSDLDVALESTARGHQVNEISLSIWTTQHYKRYVRSRMTDSPRGGVDQLFVPPNVADAISTAVFNGKDGDACMMLRDLWAPFGPDSIPRLLIVLAKYGADANHWVVHRFSLPDGQLTTYDTYFIKCLPDVRPIEWWFAIRLAWPDETSPSPDEVMHKMVRLHSQRRLGVDNAVIAAGIWRNLLMGFGTGDLNFDQRRILRESINYEVKGLRQRKLMGRLSIGVPKPNGDNID